MGLTMWTAPYELQPIGWNGGRARHGALLKVEDPRLGVGYADCHPWEERGDLSLAQQLKRLHAGATTPLTERSLFFARLDAAARSARRNLFSDLVMPTNHWLIPQLTAGTMDAVALARARGFSLLKIKMTGTSEEMTLLESLVDRFPNMKLRLDGKMGDEQRLANVRCSIDFLEDPFPYDAKSWQACSERLGVRLARDRGVESGMLEGVSVAVIKPAMTNPLPLMGAVARQQRLAVFTSYLDHPVGQVCAAYAAAIAARNFPGAVATCGLASHLVYEPNVFSDMLRMNGPQLIPPASTGFGFDELLEKGAWKKL